jgi:hypothetical protein
MTRTGGEHDEKHLAFIRQLPCIICGDDDTSTEACHIRFADAALAKPESGSFKPADYWTLPMCGKHHQLQHRGNERKFWADVGIDPLKYAMRLFTVSGNYQSGLAVLKATKQMTDI